MKHAAVFVLLLMVSVFQIVSCGDSGDDGVVIVPSNRGETVTAETTAVTESAQVTEVFSEEAVPTETEAMTAAVIPSEDTDALTRAQGILEDADFLAYLEQFGVASDEEQVLGAVAAVLAYQSAQIIVPDDDSVMTVYWTTGGSVWHAAKDCSALAKSKSVLSGDETDALAAGKTRACKRCGE